VTALGRLERLFDDEVTPRRDARVDADAAGFVAARRHAAHLSVVVEGGPAGIARANRALRDELAVEHQIAAAVRALAEDLGAGSDHALARGLPGLVRRILQAVADRRK